MKTLDVDYRGYGLAVEDCWPVWRVTIVPTRVDQLKSDLPTIEDPERKRALERAKRVIDLLAQESSVRSPV